MVITHHGGFCFKITHGDVTLAVNPSAKESKLKGAKFGSDIALVSVKHPDMNGVEQVTHGERAPVAITGPGEYEVQDIFIKGFPSTTRHDTKGEDTRINTVYLVKMEGMDLLILGALGDGKLAPEVLEEIDSVDLLFVPVGGGGMLTPAEAHKIAVSLDAKVMIPCGHEGVGEKDSLKTFLKETGAEGSKPVDKYTIKRKDIEGLSGEVVVLSS